MSAEEITAILKKRKQSEEDIADFLKWLKADIPDQRSLDIYYGEFLKIRYGKRAVINHII